LYIESTHSNKAIFLDTSGVTIDLSLHVHGITTFIEDPLDEGHDEPFRHLIDDIDTDESEAIL
jgi:hypothetical protein